MPRRLAPGACIGVIAPAGPAPQALVDQVAPWLAARGFRSRVFPGCHERLAYLAGDDELRLADLHAAFADPEVDAIVCLRGGYGSARLLDRINVGLLARHPKPLVGYSDITALHGVLNQRCGMAAWHGPMLTSDLLRPGREACAAALMTALQRDWRVGDELPRGDAAPLALVPGRARGPLLGGNLAIIVSLLGTPWALDLRGAVLFVEEVGEEPYKVDRMLTQLRLAGVLDQAAGFVVGRFSDAANPSEVIASFLQPQGKPALIGWPAGHGAPHWPLPLGVEVELDAGTLRLA
jgi:muramoyltetrapeptide carboxypeptidase